MSALANYVTQVQRLLHDSSAQFWSVAELQDYINEARFRTVRDTGCYRNLQSLYLSTGVEAYPFGGVTGFLITNGGTGYTAATTVTVAISSLSGAVQATATPTITNGVITSIQVVLPGTLYTSRPLVTITDSGGGINAAATAYFIHADTIDCVNLSIYWGNSRRVLGYRDWSTFNALARGYVNYIGLPSLCSVYNYSSIYVATIPDQTYQADLDSIMLPPLLVNNTTIEVIPPVMQDPVQYFAAHLAKVKSQRWDEADKFYQRYNIEIIKAINSSFTRRLPNPYFNR
jgi:hypothetical protein